MGAIPVIDIFAGPGGLGEGFACAETPAETPAFKVCLSIEKEPAAHRTLELRTFYRCFAPDAVPDEYYLYLKGKLLRNKLFSNRKFRDEVHEATQSAWLAELGKVAYEAVDARICKGLENDTQQWVLIGGPPCQAYSLVGRSRMIGTDPEKFMNDSRHYLYSEYLRILAKHRPAVFIFENVKGILSAKLRGRKFFDDLLMDLRHPGQAITSASKQSENCPALRYNVFSLTGSADCAESLFNDDSDPRCFVVKSEEFGIPQTRHRTILLGVRSDITVKPDQLKPCKCVALWDVIKNMPKLRSGLSREPDSDQAWLDAISAIKSTRWFQNSSPGNRLKQEIEKHLKVMVGIPTRGGEYTPAVHQMETLHKWYLDDRLAGVCNHTGRSHIRMDLQRYFFISCFGLVEKRSPKLADFPAELLPRHKNVQDGISNGKFSDRFRVQLKDEPTKTITSHIGRDGHYFIHPDPTQCRSLTVREAARVQTFPDNYFFEGPRTSQYQQVGNAVPPLLARQIADIVYNLLSKAGKVEHG